MCVCWGFKLAGPVIRILFVRVCMRLFVSYVSVYVAGIFIYIYVAYLWFILRGIFMTEY